VLANACCGRKGLALPGKLVAVLSNPANRIVIHRPASGTAGLSCVDISLLAKPGVEAIWLHGTEGTVTRGALTPQARALLLRNTSEEASDRFFRIICGVGYRLYDVLDDAIRAGKVSVDQAKMIHQHRVCLALRSAGILDYSSERAPGRRLRSRRS
jgi:hypothetical protein